MSWAEQPKSFDKREIVLRDIFNYASQRDEGGIINVTADQDAVRPYEIALHAYKSREDDTKTKAEWDFVLRTLLYDFVTASEHGFPDEELDIIAVLHATVMQEDFEAIISTVDAVQQPSLRTGH